MRMHCYRVTLQVKVYRFQTIAHVYCKRGKKSFKALHNVCIVWPIIITNGIYYEIINGMANTHGNYVGILMS